MGQGPSLFFQQQWLGAVDPNWTHIYCARFSWCVTGTMMPQLESLARWLCMLFWKAFFPLVTVILVQCPAAISENCLMLRRKGWWRLGSSLVVEIQCHNNPFILCNKKARMCETARRVTKLPLKMSVQERLQLNTVIFSPVFGAECEQSREAC